MTEELLKNRLKDILNRLENGCGRNGCRIKPPNGQAPNGPCQCGPVTLSAELHRLADEILQVKTERRLRL